MSSAKLAYFEDLSYSSYMGHVSGRSNLGHLLNLERLERGLALNDLEQSSGLAMHAISRILKLQACSLQAALKLGRAMEMPDTLVAGAWMQDRLLHAGVRGRVLIVEED